MAELHSIYAVINRNLKIIELLLKYGANKNIEDNKGLKF